MAAKNYYISTIAPGTDELTLTYDKHQNHLSLLALINLISNNGVKHGLNDVTKAVLEGKVPVGERFDEPKGQYGAYLAAQMKRLGATDYNKIKDSDIVKVITGAFNQNMWKKTDLNNAEKEYRNDGSQPIGLNLAVAIDECLSNNGRVKDYKGLSLSAQRYSVTLREVENESNNVTLL